MSVTQLFLFSISSILKEQLSIHYEEGHGLDSLEQAPKDLPEIFCLMFKSLGLSPLSRLTNNIYIQGGCTCLMWRKVAK